MFQKKLSLFVKIISLGILVFIYSCNHEYIIYIYNLENSKLKLNSIDKDDNLTIYPFFNLNESEIITIDNSFASDGVELAHQKINDVQFSIINTVNKAPVYLYNTIIINDIPYSPIIVKDSELSKKENFYFGHLIKSILFEDFKNITSKEKSLKYCNGDVGVNCNILSPLIVSLNEKKQFSLIHFSNSQKLMQTKKNVLIKYLKALNIYLSKSGIDGKYSGHLGNNIVLALNKLDNKYTVDPL
ncbi:hypothetical protein [Flavobacterium covae]|uniref:hypothetical protein n=1 Tax=Flavobacterium covae TaxID=2906076 RepID=UPI000AE36736|nr:hypothetical protein [Flavobacterium covae]